MHIRAALRWRCSHSDLPAGSRTADRACGIHRRGYDAVQAGDHPAYRPPATYPAKSAPSGMNGILLTPRINARPKILEKGFPKRRMFTEKNDGASIVLYMNSAEVIMLMKKYPKARTMFPSSQTQMKTAAQVENSSAVVRPSTLSLMRHHSISLDLLSRTCTARLVSHV